MTIAVIDSGVNIHHPHICAPTHGVLLKGSPHSSFEDTLGHGTAVLAAIHESVPDAEYFAVKLFGDSLRATSAQLIEALEWAIDQRIGVVNLSLGTPNVQYRSQMEGIVQRASETGTILVAARSSGEFLVMPGCLPGVISVEVDWTLSRDQYRVADGVFFASGFPRPVPGVPPAHNLNGVSFAVANMTAFVARACERLPVRSFAAVFAALSANARSSK